jgi:hypothetical protein
VIKIRGQSSVSIPTILDVEATGLAALSYPIEVSDIHRLGKRFCHLIKPQSDWTHWDAQAGSLHGISRQLLAEKGLSATESVFDEKAVYSDGWMVDDTGLIKLFHAANVTKSFHVSSLEMILNQTQMSLWHSTKDGLFHQMKEQGQRGSGDAALIQNTFVTT